MSSKILLEKNVFLAGERKTYSAGTGTRTCTVLVQVVIVQVVLLPGTCTA